MSKLTRKAVLKLARLSRLKLSDEEVDRFAVELTHILEYVETLNSVDVQGLEPTYQVTGLKNVTRYDEIKKYQAQPKDLLARAPAAKDGQYKVKRIVG
jgi:aspartyl-tRNA(Asn)/glutamyl-tRNA(Gln) amidotransferase subunit C